MPLRCSCGAELPPDARFCHKCGKPQFETTPAFEAAEEEIVAHQAPPLIPPRAEINFRNPAAVRTALLMALVGSLLSSLPIPPQPLWLLVSLMLAGLLASFLYVRRTGETLSVLGGARIGWITGIFSFLIATIFYTLAVFVISRNAGIATFYREQLKGRVGSEADLERFLEILQSPAGLGTVLFLTLGMLFVLFTVFPTLGGALGARLFARGRS